MYEKMEQQTPWLGEGFSLLDLAWNAIYIVKNLFFADKELWGFKDVHSQPKIYIDQNFSTSRCNKNLTLRQYTSAP